MFENFGHEVSPQKKKTRGLNQANAVATELPGAKIPLDIETFRIFRADGMMYMQ